MNSIRAAVIRAAGPYALLAALGLVFFLDRLLHPSKLLYSDRSATPTTSPFGSGAPIAMLHHLEALRGYNPLDVLRYKEYLMFITDRNRPLRALDGSLTFPVINDFPVRNRSLFDLLGTRYVLQPSAQSTETRDYRSVLVDDAPLAYDFMAGGVQELASYTVYENPHAFPRAFVVSQAAPLPDRARVLAAPKSTDFRRLVLLEDYTPSVEDKALPESFRPATIKEYQPNRVVVEVDGDTPGWLVLTDIWYPGWKCAVDGEPARIHRANYLFRAVRVPAGRHEVVYRFEPDSFRWGKMISAVAGVVVLAIGLLAIVRRRRQETVAPSAWL